MISPSVRAAYAMVSARYRQLAWDIPPLPEHDLTAALNLVNQLVARVNNHRPIEITVSGTPLIIERREDVDG